MTAAPASLPTGASGPRCSGAAAVRGGAGGRGTGGGGGGVGGNGSGSFSCAGGGGGGGGGAGAGAGAGSGGAGSAGGITGCGFGGGAVAGGDGVGSGVGSGVGGDAGSGGGGGAGSGVGGASGGVGGSGMVLGCGGAFWGLGACGGSLAPPSNTMATAAGGSGSDGASRCGGTTTSRSSNTRCNASEIASAICRMRLRRLRRRRRAPGSCGGARRGAGAPAVMVSPVPWCRSMARGLVMRWLSCRDGRCARCGEVLSWRMPGFPVGGRSILRLTCGLAAWRQALQTTWKPPRTRALDDMRA